MPILVPRATNLLFTGHVPWAFLVVKFTKPNNNIVGKLLKDEIQSHGSGLYNVSQRGTCWQALINVFVVCCWMRDGRVGIALGSRGLSFLWQIGESSWSQRGKIYGWTYSDRCYCCGLRKRKNGWHHLPFVSWPSARRYSGFEGVWDNHYE